MAENSINTKQAYQLNGKDIDAALEWAGVKIVANYENDSIQPQLQINDFTFALEAREIIKKWISDGNIFEGMPLNITLFNNQPAQEKFKSILNFTELAEDFPDDGVFKAAIEKERGVVSFFDQISAVSYGYLAHIGVITDSDYTTLDYVVEKKINPLELMITSIIIYLMLKEIAEAINRTANQVGVIQTFFINGLTGPASAAIYAAITILIEIAYVATMIIAIIDLTTSLINNLLPPKRQHKVFQLRNMLTKVCNHFGYGFESNVSLLDNLHYLPSNPNQDEPDKKLGFVKRTKGTQQGIPNTQDRGYICNGAFELAKELCDGKYAVINNTIVLYPRDDPFWVKNSTYTKEPTLIKMQGWNANELFSTRLLAFLTDVADDNTIDNFKGTAIDIKTDIKNPVRPENNLLKGFDQVEFGVALASRKKELDALERLLKSLAGIVDDATKELGRRTNFANKIKTRVGMMTVTSNNHSIPKLVYLDGSRMPINHRDLFSASTIWNNYYGDSSFVRNNFRGQKFIYKGVQVPFGLEDYKKLTENSYFQEADGSEAKITKFEWEMEADTAIIDFWVRRVYTKNLKETITEP